MSGKGALDLFRIVRVIEIVDFVWILGISQIIGCRVSVNGGTCDYCQLRKPVELNEELTALPPSNHASTYGKFYKSKADIDLYAYGPSNTLPCAGGKFGSGMGFWFRNVLNSGTNCLSFLNARNELSLAQAGRLATLSPGSPMRITPGSIETIQRKQSVTVRTCPRKQLTSSDFACVGLIETDNWRL